MWALGILFVFFVVITFFMPWFQRSAIAGLRRDVDLLMRTVERLEKRGRSLSRDDFYTEPPPVETATPVATVMPEPTAIHIPHSFPPVTKQGFEIQFGSKLAVWLGGIALALAGFYLVKYSIDMGWLSPAVRTVLGLAFGVGLLLAGNLIRNRPGIANGERIAQALSGAGIADLYVCIFGATSLYHFISPLLGFAGMAAVTAVAVLLSLRHGAPIAMLGLVGGFVTPALIGSEHPSVPMLFTYLYLVLTGLLVVIRKQGWWKMGHVAVAGAFLWVLVGLMGGMAVVNGLWLSLFLLAVCGTVVMLSGTRETQVFGRTPLNSVAFAGALLLMMPVVSRSGFGYLEWGLFGLLAAGSIAMAYFNQKTYGSLAPASLGVSGIMLLLWHPADPMSYAIVLSAFAVLYAASGYFLQRRSREPLPWALQAVAAAIGFYLLGYFQLHHKIEVLNDYHFWGLTAFLLAALCTQILVMIIRALPDHSARQHLLATYASGVTAFVALGMTVELDREILTIAIAAEVLALSWISTRVDIVALRRITGIVAAVFAGLLAPQMLLLFGLSLWSLFEIRMQMPNMVPVVQWPLFQLGLPALFFAGASIFLRRQKDGRLVSAFEVAAIVLEGLMGYYLARHLLHPGENILFIVPGFAERGVITNALFLFGLACLWVGREFTRKAVTMSGLALCAVAMFRIGYFDLFMHNPLWSRGQDVGAVPLLNALLLTYGLPMAWIFVLTKGFLQRDWSIWAGRCYAFMLVLAFALVSLEVRQFYHGALLNTGPTTNAEIYTYSAVWLLFGLSLLFFGAWKKDRMIRIASLAIMVLAVGKVFLYDASELEGLYRVVSFFGLGLSLLGLSWFYSRFVLPKAAE